MVKPLRPQGIQNFFEGERKREAYTLGSGKAVVNDGKLNFTDKGQTTPDIEVDSHTNEALNGTTIHQIVTETDGTINSIHKINGGDEVNIKYTEERYRMPGDFDSVHAEGSNSIHIEPQAGQRLRLHDIGDDQVTIGANPEPVEFKNRDNVELWFTEGQKFLEKSIEEAEEESSRFNGIEEPLFNEDEGV